MNANRELAELIGWKVWQGAWKEPRIVLSNSKTISLHLDTDHNAMRKVWKVLHERGLWDEFWCAVQGKHGHAPTSMNSSDGYHFLNDLPGQVQAAIKVLREDAEDGNVSVGGLVSDMGMLREGE